MRENPLKVNYTLESVIIDQEVVYVPIGEQSSAVGGIIKANADAARIIDMIVAGDDKGSIIDRLSSEYDNNEDELVRYYDDTVAFLKDCGIIS